MVMTIRWDIFQTDNLTSVITVRKSSCGEVMFSQVSVILFRGMADPHVTITPHPHIRHGIYRATPMLLTSVSHQWSPVPTCSLEDLPQVLTSSEWPPMWLVHILLERCFVSHCE